ncbi:phosphoglucomutase 1 [Ephemerocybe angulata]|uniref:Phosphoglucomutase 1 n=1 Tax=Ephemerocybe angulata TaxID=980116 RepID=A0A8H6IG90_9AGAR|nr:phosphoglucomutase 1 [Tulosesus angulatus]
MQALENHVQEWLRLDQNSETRSEIERLWEAKDYTELGKRMNTRIEFGTAGLRGRMEAGRARMNDLTIIQASQGLCEYVIANVTDAKSKGIVVGHDHRHHSKHWAALTANVFLQNGCKVYLYNGLVHTPLVPWGVKYFKAACGVMITENFKVYWENGVQIISPHDTGIAKSIDENLEPKPTSWTYGELLTSELCVDRTEEAKDMYFMAIGNYEHLRNLPVGTEGISFVNTSMHGVSDPFVQRAFQTFGVAPYIPVEEQRLPDPEFPTVKFPNPEEKATAAKDGAEYVLAQDPDSDRFSAAEKQPSGDWHVFSGDQLGTLFASYILGSKMLEVIAKAEGFKFVECLTGFKYIGNTALDLVKAGYERLSGSCFGNDIRDKDGVAATMSFVGLVSSIRERGTNVREYLETLYKRVTTGYFICYDSAKIDAIFHRLRNYPGQEKDRSYPLTIGGLPITRVVDLTLGYDSQNPPTYEPSLPLSSGHMVQFRAGRDQDEARLMLTIRTSGTEPKIKYYLEGTGSDETKIVQFLSNVVEELGRDWMEAERNELLKP